MYVYLKMNHHILKAEVQDDVSCIYLRVTVRHFLHAHMQNKQGQRADIVHILCLHLKPPPHLDP
jgi:hypothetical protein